MDIVILYEDDDVVVVDKPSGVLVHEDLPAQAGVGESREDTVAAWHAARVPEAATVGEPMRLRDGTTINRPGIVHRLDRDTSGVMVLAKNQQAFLLLKAQFQNHLVQKEYRAFVHGDVKEVRGMIDRPIGRSAKDFRLRSAQRGAKGTLREAVTAWERLGVHEGFSYLSLLPKTGRTHQLRVHLKAINHPIVCDTLYAPARAPRAGGPKAGCALGFSRLALHAHRLTATLPNGRKETFEAPLPEDFQAATTAFV